MTPSPRLGLFLLAFAGLVSTSPAQNPPGKKANSVKSTLSWRHEEKATVDYLVFLPEGYHKTPGKKWPLIVYLHGGGGNENSLRKRLAPLQRRPFVILAPICPPLPEGVNWIYQAWDARIVGAVTRKVLADYPIDPKRVILMGFSMGGSGAWAVPFRHPDLFHKVVVISGSCHPWKLRHYPKIPVRSYSGEKESWLPQHTNSVNSAKSFGVDVTHKIWPGATHGQCCTQTLRDESLWQWLTGAPGDPTTDAP